MLMLERPNEALVAGGLEGAPVVAGVVEDSPAVAAVPGGAPFVGAPCCAVGTGGCRNSDGVLMNNHARKAQPTMMAQREGGSVRTAVTIFWEADLIGDGIDYTVAGTGAAAPVKQKMLRAEPYQPEGLYATSAAR